MAENFHKKVPIISPDKEIEFDNEDDEDRCGICNSRIISTAVAIEKNQHRARSGSIRKVLCDKYFEDHSQQYEQDDKSFDLEEPRGRSTELEKPINLSEKKCKEIDGDLHAPGLRSSLSTESYDLYYAVEIDASALENVDVAIATEPLEKKPYPVLWLEHPENVIVDHHVASEQQLRDNKFVLETFTSHAFCNNHLQSDATGKCFIIVGDSWGEKFLEKQISKGEGIVRFHDHPKLAAVYVYAVTSDNYVLHDTVPEAGGAAVTIERPSQTKQSSVNTSVRKPPSRLTCCLRKCCNCCCSSDSTALEENVDVPLLAQSSDIVVETQQILPIISKIASRQPLGDNINENRIANNEQDWTKKFPKVRGSFTNFEDLLAQMCEDQITVKEEVDNLLALSIIKRDEASVESAKTGNFIWFQIFIEALRRMDDNRDAAKAELLSLCRLLYENDKSTLRVLNEFEASYIPQDAVRWYSESTCFFRLLNKALRFSIYDTIIAFRLLIHDLCAQLDDEHEKEKVGLNIDTPIMRVYRGQWMKLHEFKDLSNSIGELVLVKSFLSATMDSTVARNFVFGGQINAIETPVILIIDADKRLVTGAFANVSHLSAFQMEREVLFTPGSIFRIKGVDKNDDNAYYIMELELCDQDDHELKDTYKYIRDGLPSQIDFTGLGDVLLKMNEFRSSRKCHERALQIPQTNDFQKLQSMIGLANLSSRRGNYENALKIHKEVLSKRIHNLSSNDKSIGICYVNIGIEYYHLKKFDTALFYYEKARQIFNECYPANHPAYCQFANNVAVAYAAKVQYGKAKSHLETAERILEAVRVPKTHPDTATILGNLGAVYSQLEDADKAMNFQQRAFDIRQKSLPSEHLDMALSNHNLAIVHESRNDYQLALLYYKEALRIKLSCLAKKSPGYLETWECYKDLCQKIQDSNTMGIIIVGPSKSGKSSFGNILAGTNHFQAHRLIPTTESAYCHHDFSDKRLIIVDTPSTLVDNAEEQNNTNIQDQIKKCNVILQSYLRAILIVISSDAQPNATDINAFFQQLDKHFGEETVQQKCILILTRLDLIHAEDGRTTADHLQRTPHLQEWIKRCNGKYFDGSKLQAGTDVTQASHGMVAEIVETIRLLRTYETVPPSSA